MEALELSILAKNRQPSSAPMKLNDFDYAEKTSVSANVILTNPNISLFCLDHDHKRAIFVQTPKAINIYKQPFLYNAQYEHAEKLFTLPYETLHKLSETLPEPKLILLYSLCRCGSTLLNNAFNELDTVFSFSEPDVFFNLTALRDIKIKHDIDFIKLSQSSLKLLSKQLKKEDACVIKFRGFSIEIADLLYQAAPNAHHLFLYRNAEPWAKSMARSTKLLETNGLKREPLRPLFNGYPRENFLSYLSQFNARARNWSMLENFALGWLSMMNRYLEHWQAGIPFAALRYEDLIQNPEAMLRKIFDYCGLAKADTPQALQAFSKDSQEGTRFSGKANRQDKTLELNEEHLEQVRAVLRYHVTLNEPDVSLPNTLSISR